MTAHSKTRLVAFTGRIGHGKSAAAHYLIAQHGFDRVSFADPLKAMLMTLGLKREQLYDPKKKEIPTELLLGKTPREGMQTLGTDWGRKLIHPDIWVVAARHFMQQKLLDGHQLVIDDLRFDNEALVVLELGGVVLEVVRPSLVAKDKWWTRLLRLLRLKRVHASEHGISRHLIGQTLINDSSLDDLYSKVDTAIARAQRPLAA